MARRPMAFPLSCPPPECHIERRESATAYSQALAGAMLDLRQKLVAAPVVRTEGNMGDRGGQQQGRATELGAVTFLPARDSESLG